MSERMLFDDDVLEGRTRHLHFEGSKISLETTWDVTQLLEEAKQNKKDLEGKGFKGDGMHFVGNIPPFALKELMLKGVLGPGCEVLDQKGLAAWFSENNYFSARKM